MVDYSTVIIPLSVALALSLVVERILEFASLIMEPLMGSKGTRKIPGLEDLLDLIESIQSNLHQARLRESAEISVEDNADQREKLIAQLAGQDPGADDAQQALARSELQTEEKMTEWGENFDQSTVLSVPATDPDDGYTLKVFSLQIIGFAAGILLARAFDVQLFSALIIHQADYIIPSMDYLLTGLLIGGGSKPMHLLVRFVTQRKLIVGKETDSEEERDVRDSTPVVRVPVIEVSAGALPLASDQALWVDVPYAGGVDREQLESVHLRQQNPTMIVYHHTAMHSDSRFDDVVNVIKSRTDSKGNHWVTGYNCVVMADGAIKPFCRWDRYGNHAAGVNRRSLGLAFNGNFETDAKVSFSNPDGRMGRQRPTQAQLKAGARVVALWAALYDIELDFEKNIVPHRAISSKACPGNNFPYDEFEHWVGYYAQQWKASAHAMERISAFKLKPYLYV